MSEQNDLDTIRDFLNCGGTLQVLMDISPKDLDYVYSYACHLFETGDYANAKRFNMMLVRLSHWQYDYWLALGLCCQRLSEHEQALFCFGQAGLLRLDDPSPVYLAGLCYLQLRKYEKAKTTYLSALRLCSRNENFIFLKMEIERQISLFSERVEE